MNKNATKAINGIIKIEGGYVNDSSDSGGATRYGITIAVARKSGYRGKMSLLPRWKAVNIYQARYWDSMHLDSILEIAPKLTDKLFDAGVNLGVPRVSKILQQSLNSLNHKYRYGSNLKTDGQIGSKTIKMLKLFKKHRGSKTDKTLVKMVQSLQGAHYIKIANKYPKNKKFTFGWVDNRLD